MAERARTRGIEKLETTIADLNDGYDQQRDLIGIVPCIVPGIKSGLLYSEALTYLADGYGELVTPPIRRSVRVPEAYSYESPLPLHAPKDPVTQDYRKVLDFLQAKKALP